MMHSSMARIRGAATALILALPAAAWAVGSTPVTVVNPDNNAAAVRDAGQPQSVSGGCGYFPISGDHCDLYTVPAGKRLVVELFSFRLASDNAGSNEPYVVVLGRSTVIFCFNCSDFYAFSPGTGHAGPTVTLWSDTRPVRFYLDENQTLSVTVSHNGSNSWGQAFTFSGFLVNK